MKKIIAFTLAIALISGVYYLNAVVSIDYHVNLMEYVQYSQDYSKEERAILEKLDVLVFGGTLNEPPMVRYYEETNQHVGFVIDSTNALAIELQTDIITKSMNWRDVLEALAIGEVDLADMVPTEERGQQYLFTKPLYALRGMVVTPVDGSVASLEDLSGKRVAVQQGDVVIDHLKEQELKVTLVYTDSIYSAIELLFAGAVDAVAGDEPVMRAILRNADRTEHYRFLKEPIYDSVSVLAVSRDKPELVPLLNKAIFKLQQAGVIENIESKWLGTAQSNAQIRSYQKLKQIWIPVLGIGAMLFSMILLWNRSLQRLVDHRTRELSILTDELESVFVTIESGVLLMDDEQGVRKINPLMRKWTDLRVGDQIATSRLGEAIDPSYLSHGLEGRLDLRIHGRVFDLRILSIESMANHRLIVMSDVTLDRIRQEKLVRENKMEAIGRLAAAMAHELRNPLGIIRNSSYILATAPHAEKETVSVTEAIDRAIERANRIIDNLLNYARLTGVEHTSVQVHELVRDVLTYYRKVCKESEISIHFFHEGNPSIVINSNVLRHVLINLVENGIDAMDQSGELTIKTSVSDQELQLTVSDTGVGIEREHMDQIFEPFFSSKTTNGGTGLGLYIVYTLVQESEGDIQVSSSIGEGTTFSVTLPKREGTNAFA